MPLQQAREHTGLMVLLLLALAVYGFAVVRTAWLCDDSFVTFRTVDNFVKGYGLTWNTDERVQAYTHPLWMFLVSGFYALSGEIYYTAIFVSMGVSLAAVLVYCLRIACSRAQAIIGVLIFAFSKAFVDYSTSGLENPLSHLLVAIFLAIYLSDRTMTPRRLFWLSLTAGLGVLNRMDTLLLFGPALLLAWWNSCAAVFPSSVLGAHSCRPGRPMSLAVLFAGFLPFAAWEVFSLIYYGFPFPNTAYAKLNTGLPAGALLKEGLNYLRDSVINDPLTAVVIGLALVSLVVRPDRKRIAIGAGIVMYVLYVVKIGGDFMSGRFLTVPLMAAVILLGRLPVRLSPANWLATALLTLCVGFTAPHPSILTLSSYGLGWNWDFEHVKVADERAFYYPSTGLFGDSLGILTVVQDVLATAEKRRTQGSLVTGFGMIGLYGYTSGPNLHVIDHFALSEPLLARLPMRYNPTWRIGHFTRHVPDGYIERLQYLREKERAEAEARAAGRPPQAIPENHFSDPDIQVFHDKLCLITRGPLFARERWEAIWNMNLGRYNFLINYEFYRNPPERVWLGEVYGGPKPRGIARDLKRDDEGNVPLPPVGIIVILGRPIHAPQIELSVDGNDDYRIDYPQLGRRPVRQEVPAVSQQPGQVVRRIDVPADVVAQGYDRFRILPIRGDGRYSLRHVVPVDNRGQPPADPDRVR